MLRFMGLQSRTRLKRLSSSSSLTFRSLIHIEFIFVYGVRKCFSFIILQVVDQFSQHHLLKRLPFPLYIFASFVKDKVSMGMGIYFWPFYFFRSCWFVFSIDLCFCLCASTILS